VLHVRSCTYAPEQQNKCPRNSPGLLSRASDAVSDDYVGESNEPGIEQPKHAVSVSGNIITAQHLTNQNKKNPNYATIDV